jgi:hypothetical protein
MIMIQRKAHGYLATVVVILAAGVVFAMGVLSLPTSPVTVSHGTWNAGSNSTIEITLSDVSPGYDVINGIYAGWCAEDNYQDDLDGAFYLLDSTDPEALASCDWENDNWDLVNYLLNHQNGTIEDVQAAIWVLLGYYGGTFAITTEAQNMIDEAEAMGEGFVPAPGEVTAVVICVDGPSGSDSYQDTLIEVEVPRGGQGCTPGYWKQPHHLFAWLHTGYTPADLYGTVFSVDDTDDFNLLQALWIGGGRERALYRHATAGLLNAASPDVDYYYTVGEVMQMVQDAYDTEHFNYYKNMLEDANQMGCPLGNGGPGGPGRLAGRRSRN